MNTFHRLVAIAVLALFFCSIGSSLRPHRISRARSRRRITRKEKEREKTKEEETKDFEGSPRETSRKTSLVRSCPPPSAISLNGVGRLSFKRLTLPYKTKTGNLAAPRFRALIFAAVALISVSGGTHRVRGVMVAVCVLSPVESTSPP
jgi:hypothetical protein